MRKEITLQETINLIDNKYKSFKDFIKSIKPTYCELRETENEIVFDEVSYFGRQYMIIIPYKIKNKSPKIMFRDDLTDINKLWECYSVDTDITKPLYEKLISNIESLNCKLYNSGSGGNETYEWYDLAMDLKDFNEEVLKKCTKLWCDYNNELSKYESEE